MALQILRPRQGMSFQVTKSQYEVVPDGRPHRFEANVDIERGDIVGVELSGGASIGVRRDVPGAETGAGCLPCAAEKPQSSVPARASTTRSFSASTSSQARSHALRNRSSVRRRQSSRLGKIRARRKIELVRGQPLQLALVEVGDRVVLDLFLEAHVPLGHARPAAGRRPPDLRRGPL